tara:strand:- start:1465 stop:1848 length:384 start_codon:yes stop_codon:yes gene_type:complete
MKIFGIGTDLTNVKRIKQAIKKNNNFLNKIYTKKELSKCLKLKSKYNCLAKRFAAKEAFSKSLGTGISKGMSFNEIEITNNHAGKPSIKLFGTTKKIFDKKIKKKFKIFLSLSDEKYFAFAYVVLGK